MAEADDAVTDSLDPRTARLVAVTGVAAALVGGFALLLSLTGLVCVAPRAPSGGGQLAGALGWIAASSFVSLAVARRLPSAMRTGPRESARTLAALFWASLLAGLPGLAMGMLLANYSVLVWPAGGPPPDATALKLVAILQAPLAVSILVAVARLRCERDAGDTPSPAAAWTPRPLDALALLLVLIAVYGAWECTRPKWQSHDVEDCVALLDETSPAYWFGGGGMSDRIRGNPAAVGPLVRRLEAGPRLARRVASAAAAWAGAPGRLLGRGRDWPSIAGAAESVIRWGVLGLLGECGADASAALPVLEALVVPGSPESAEAVKSIIEVGHAAAPTVSRLLQRPAGWPLVRAAVGFGKDLGGPARRQPIDEVFGPLLPASEPLRVREFAVLVVSRSKIYPLLGEEGAPGASLRPVLAAVIGRDVAFADGRDPPPPTPEIREFLLSASSDPAVSSPDVAQACLRIALDDLEFRARLERQWREQPPPRLTCARDQVGRDPRWLGILARLWRGGSDEVRARVVAEYALHESQSCGWFGRSLAYLEAHTDEEERGAFATALAEIASAANAPSPSLEAPPSPAAPAK